MTVVRVDGRYKVFWISTLCLSDHARLVNCGFTPHAALRRYDALLAREHRLDLGTGIESCSNARSRVWLSITIYLAHALRGYHTVCRDMCLRRRHRRASEREYTA